MSSIKKRSKVRRILRTMFGEANVRQIKNGLYGLGHLPVEPCIRWKRERKLTEHGRDKCIQNDDGSDLHAWLLPLSFVTLA